MARVYKLMDLTGRKFGLLTVVEKVSTNGTVDGTVWRAQCYCGGTIDIPHKTVTGKKKLNCGCGIRKTGLEGTQYGKLTLVDESPKKDASGVRVVSVECSCGIDSFYVRLNNLTSGNTTSCGCQQGTHKMSNTRTYQIWEGMKRRCRPDLYETYPYHSGRGITVCDEWDKFENFYADMGLAPNDMSLDRIDVNGNYCKENCRWATNSIQGYNKGLDPNNTSGKSGVSFYKQAGKWSAEIHVNNEHIRLGMFVNFEDAVKAREAAELKYYGWNKE